MFETTSSFILNFFGGPDENWTRIWRVTVANSNHLNYWIVFWWWLWELNPLSSGLKARRVHRFTKPPNYFIFLWRTQEELNFHIVINSHSFYLWTMSPFGVDCWVRTNACLETSNCLANSPLNHLSKPTFGASGEIWTLDSLIKSQVLCRWVTDANEEVISFFLTYIITYLS